MRVFLIQLLRRQWPGRCQLSLPLRLRRTHSARYRRTNTQRTAPLLPLVLDFADIEGGLAHLGHVLYVILWDGVQVLLAVGAHVLG